MTQPTSTRARSSCSTPIPRPATSTRVHLPHAEIFAAIKPGDVLLIDDGKLRLQATETGPQRIVARVEVGGKVSNRKGVSLPDTVDSVGGTGGKGHRRPGSGARRRY